jgi:hypothetical protein
MNPSKEEALARIEAIEKETEELRKIIERPEKLVYNPCKFYVGIKDGLYYMLIGFSVCNNYGFYSCKHGHWQLYSRDGSKSGQACLDCHLNVFDDIKVFDNWDEGMHYFYARYKE